MISEMNLQDLENIKDCLLTDFDNFWSYNILKQELEMVNQSTLLQNKKMKL